MLLSTCVFSSFAKRSCTRRCLLCGHFLSGAASCAPSPFYELNQVRDGLGIRLHAERYHKCCLPSSSISFLRLRCPALASRTASALNLRLPLCPRSSCRRPLSCSVDITWTSLLRARGLRFSGPGAAANNSVADEPNRLLFLADSPNDFELHPFDDSHAWVVGRSFYRFGANWAFQMKLRSIDPECHTASDTGRVLTLYARGIQTE